MTEFRTLSSGSSGNAALVSCGGCHLLIDLGLSCRRLLRALADLNLSPHSLAAILITHEHTDHIGGLATYIKSYSTPIYCAPGTARQLSYRLAGIDPLLRPSDVGMPFPVGPLEITPFPNSHDCGECTAFHIRTPDGVIGYLTDTGFILDQTRDALRGADLLVLESNHDVERLRGGPYPLALKKRILGPMGHLSNTDAADFAVESAKAGTRAILLAHLSRENNTPQLALGTVGQALENYHCQVRLSAAPRTESSECFVLGVEDPCAV